MKKKSLLLLVASCGLTFLFGEISLRFVKPGLGAEMVQKAYTGSPICLDQEVGYELKPHALVEVKDEQGVRTLEQLNGEGFRGPEYAVEKPAGVFRLLTVGDSVCESMSIPFADSWEQALEQNLNRRTAQSGNPTKYEVINAGVRGYVSWQARARLERRGLKYHPDMVIALVGWNDLAYSPLSTWQPGMVLTQIPQALAPPVEEKQTPLVKTRDVLSQYFYSIRLVRKVRGYFINGPQIRSLTEQRQHDTGRPFNEEALKLYRQNLERIYQLTTANGARLGLVVWPNLLKTQLLSDPDIYPLMLVTYLHVELSTRELWAWYGRYVDALRQFGAQHPDVVLIDAEAAFARKDKAERLRAFVDMGHLTVAGNHDLGEVVANTLVQQGIVK
jgi:hypothetical protein